MKKAAEIRDVHDEALMWTHPLVSVHMLAYRHGRFLAQAIEGVLAQTCEFPFELVIAEDCSPDNTLEIALTYQKKHPEKVRVVTGSANVGMHRNAERSVPLCRGKYMAFCEGDDYWHRRDKLQMQISMMEADASIAFCHTDFDRMTRFRLRKNVHRGKMGRYRPAHGNAYESLLFTWSVMTATSVYRSDIVFEFFRSLFHTHNWPFGDLNLLLFASLKGRVGYIDESTATFRKMRGSAGNRGFEAALNMQLAAEECIALFLQHYPVPEEALLHIIAARKLSIYSPAYYAGRVELMQESFEWLDHHGFRPNWVGHRLRLLAIALGLPFRIDRWLKDFITSHLSAIPP